MATPAFLLSVVASLLSVSATLPQIIKILKQASSNDLSLACFAMHTIAGILWCFYGALIAAPVLAVEAAIVAILNLIVVVHILEQHKIHKPTYQKSSLRTTAAL